MKQSTLEQRRSLAVSMLLIAATIAAGLGIRFGHLGLPPVIVKFGGSALWAVMIYWIVATLLPSARWSRWVVWSGVTATAVELIKLYHVRWLDSFRITLPGALLLGRYFSAWDIVVYWAAIVLVASMDHRLTNCTSNRSNL